MTTTETTGAGGSGDGDQPKQTPEIPKDTEATETTVPEVEKDKEAVKKEVLSTVKETLKEKVQTPPSQGGKFRVRPGGFLGAALRQGGMRAEKPTAEKVQKREEEGKKAKEEVAAKKKSIQEEFWGAYDKLGEFGYSPVSSGRHLTGGADPDRATIDFFAAKRPHVWLAEQGRGSFELVRSKSEAYGDGISFTVYFLDDLTDSRRSVAGYLQQGKLTIVHVGPIQ